MAESYQNDSERTGRLIGLELTPTIGLVIVIWLVYFLVGLLVVTRYLNVTRLSANLASPAGAMSYDKWKAW